MNQLSESVAAAMLAANNFNEIYLPASSASVVLPSIAVTSMAATAATGSTALSTSAVANAKLTSINQTAASTVTTSTPVHPSNETNSQSNAFNQAVQFQLNKIKPVLNGTDVITISNNKSGQNSNQNNNYNIVYNSNSTRSRSYDQDSNLATNTNNTINSSVSSNQINQPNGNNLINLKSKKFKPTTYYTSYANAKQEIDYSNYLYSDSVTELYKKKEGNSQDSDKITFYTLQHNHPKSANNNNNATIKSGANQNQNLSNNVNNQPYNSKALSKTIINDLNMLYNKSSTNDMEAENRSKKNETNQKSNDSSRKQHMMTNDMLLNQNIALAKNNLIKQQEVEEQLKQHQLMQQQEKIHQQKLQLLQLEQIRLQKEIEYLREQQKNLKNSLNLENFAALSAQIDVDVDNGSIAKNDNLSKTRPISENNNTLKIPSSRSISLEKFRDYVTLNNKENEKVNVAKSPRSSSAATRDLLNIAQNYLNYKQESQTANQERQSRVSQFKGAIVDTNQTKFDKLIEPIFKNENEFLKFQIEQLTSLVDNNKASNQALNSQVIFKQIPQAQNQNVSVIFDKPHVQTNQQPQIPQQQQQQQQQHKQQDQIQNQQFYQILQSHQNKNSQFNQKAPIMHPQIQKQPPGPQKILQQQPNHALSNPIQQSQQQIPQQVKTHNQNQNQSQNQQNMQQPVSHQQQNQNQQTSQHQHQHQQHQNNHNQQQTMQPKPQLSSIYENEAMQKKINKVLASLPPISISTNTNMNPHIGYSASSKNLSNVNNQTNQPLNRSSTQYIISESGNSKNDNYYNDISEFISDLNLLNSSSPVQNLNMTNVVNNFNEETYKLRNPQLNALSTSENNLVNKLDSPKVKIIAKDSVPPKPSKIVRSNSSNSVLTNELSDLTKNYNDNQYTGANNLKANFVYLDPNTNKFSNVPLGSNQITSQPKSNLQTSKSNIYTDYVDYKNERISPKNYKSTSDINYMNVQGNNKSNGTNFNSNVGNNYFLMNYFYDTNGNKYNIEDYLYKPSENLDYEYIKSRKSPTMRSPPVMQKSSIIPPNLNKVNEAKSFTNLVDNKRLSTNSPILFTKPKNPNEMNRSNQVNMPIKVNVVNLPKPNSVKQPVGVTHSTQSKVAQNQPIMLSSEPVQIKVSKSSSTSAIIPIIISHSNKNPPPKKKSPETIPIEIVTTNKNTNDIAENSTHIDNDDSKPAKGKVNVITNDKLNENNSENKNNNHTDAVKETLSDQVLPTEASDESEKTEKIHQLAKESEAKHEKAHTDSKKIDVKHAEKSDKSEKSSSSEATKTANTNSKKAEGGKKSNKSAKTGSKAKNDVTNEENLNEEVSKITSTKKKHKEKSSKNSKQKEAKKELASDASEDSKETKKTKQSSDNTIAQAKNNLTKQENKNNNKISDNNNFNVNFSHEDYSENSEDIKQADITNQSATSESEYLNQENQDNESDSDVLNESIDVDDLNINDYGDRLPKSYSNEFNSRPKFRKLYGYDYNDLECEFETNDLNDNNSENDDDFMSVVQDIKSSVNNVLCNHKLSSFASNIEVILEETEEEEQAEREYYNSLQRAQQDNQNDNENSSEESFNSRNALNDSIINEIENSNEKILDKSINSEENDYKNEYFEIVY